MAIYKLFTCQTGNLKTVYTNFNNDGTGKQNVNGSGIGNSKKIFYTGFTF